MPKLLMFNKSIRGASHIRSGKPCQDFSLSYDDENIKILVVCDGHGGSTYFRSNIGAEIAAKVCLENLRQFAAHTPGEIFEGTSFAITAKPQKNPFIDADGNRVRFEDLDESQQQYAKQAQAYIEAENICQAQQELIRELLGNIYSEWLDKINQDSNVNPFSRNERNILANNSIEKAYGCTMLAFLQTKHYWISFHIGDGKIYMCNRNLSWNTPVPEDCTCFLNYTTSLCDSNPLIEFRYVFNGTGYFPFAVMLCSDGLDGSLRTHENIIDFYEQIIDLQLDGDDVGTELENYLPQLSELGNKDDISLAGFIDTNAIDSAKAKVLLDLKKQSRKIQIEFKTKKQEIETLSSRIESLRIRLDRHRDNRFMKQTELEEIRQSLKERESIVEELDKIITNSRKEIEVLENTLSDKISSFDDWNFNVKNQMAEIEAQQNELIDATKEHNKQDYTNW